MLRDAAAVRVVVFADVGPELVGAALDESPALLFGDDLLDGKTFGVRAGEARG